MSMTIADHTCQTYVSLFNDQGKELLGVSADQMAKWKDEGEDAMRKRAAEQDASEASKNSNCTRFHLLSRRDKKQHTHHAFAFYRQGQEDGGGTGGRG